MLERLRLFISSFPRRRESGDFRASASKSLDSRVRGNDEQTRSRDNDASAGKAPVYVAAKRGEPKRREGRGGGR
ncbi:MULTISPECIES: hypothetical protein [unclassified Lysobacter]|uniref:hypothetical protein n=1 Tax=unclassified Lysobacter TaxID=2635362 RepID=UPI001BE6826F|nr:MULTISPECIES: hypothetical protein [unclassified Lysobacter]MBT2748178.1 hypothetical protein [Lysobacter sp. ISL-42]MBT2751133.1 hypothetical protein [Lysobacter sp. ISL-50]MBT2779920.1 hypothetical protein [Lysobacter sp. ISL-54]MBT2781871.1 hypothetical protein [Lysobacter sp. ISL-52]